MSQHHYNTAGLSWSNQYIAKPVLQVLQKELSEKRLFELGVGNGALANLLSTQGYEVTGVDLSETGIALANQHHPHLDLHVGNAYDDLTATYGTFPCVLSTEVIEHCLYPRKVIQTLYDLLEEGGVGIVTTPYHGYWKNLALALSNRMDQHFTALWDGGHVKFFSIKTMTQLLKEFGFSDIYFLRVGRPFKPLAKSMIVVFRK